MWILIAMLLSAQNGNKRGEDGKAHTEEGNQTNEDEGSTVHCFSPPLLYENIIPQILEIVKFYFIC